MSGSSKKEVVKVKYSSHKLYRAVISSGFTGSRNHGIVQLIVMNATEYITW